MKCYKCFAIWWWFSLFAFSFEFYSNLFDFSWRMKYFINFIPTYVHVLPICNLCICRFKFQQTNFSTWAIVSIKLRTHILYFFQASQCDIKSHFKILSLISWMIDRKNGVSYDGKLYDVLDFDGILISLNRISRENGKFQCYWP